jgi:hypothetical protein
MVMRGLMVAALAVSAGACAASSNLERGAQSAVYVVGDNVPLVKANAGTDGMPEREFSVVRRIYWFFAGR